MVTEGALVFIIGVALWLLGRVRGARSPYVQYVQSAPTRQVKTGARFRGDLRNLIASRTTRERVLWLTIFGTVAVMVGYHFQWWTFLAALLVASVAAVVIGLLWLFVRFVASYPAHSTEHPHTFRMPDGALIDFVIRVDWQLPNSLTEFDDEPIYRDVQARVSEWLASLTLDPPESEDEAVALIKNVSSKLTASLAPAVLPYGSYLNIAVTGVKFLRARGPTGIVIGIAE